MEISPVINDDQTCEDDMNGLCLRIREYAQNHDLTADQIEALLNAGLSTCCVLGDRAPELTRKLRRDA
jgi:hypothetical protein